MAVKWKFLNCENVRKFRGICPRNAATLSNLPFPSEAHCNFERKLWQFSILLVSPSSTIYPFTLSLSMVLLFRRFSWFDFSLDIKLLNKKSKFLCAIKYPLTQTVRKQYLFFFLFFFLLLLFLPPFSDLSHFFLFLI